MRALSAAGAAVCAALLVCFAPCARAAGMPGTRCSHDAIAASLGPAAHREPRHAQAYADSPPHPAASSLRARAAQAAGGMQPIRIVPVWADGLVASPSSATPVLPAAQVAFIESLVSSAVSTWQGLLSVNPVSGALFAAAQCADYYTDGRGCATLATDSQCTGTGATKQGPGDATLSFSKAYPAFLAGGGGAGLGGADMGLFVTALSTAQCGADGAGAVAYAVGCGRDQYDRPTWARVNVCPGMAPASTPAGSAALSALQAAVAHELGHVLGFSAESFTRFRYPADLAPRTPRDPVYGGVSSAYQVTISGGACAGFTLGVAAPNTIAYAPERGTSCSWSGTTARTSNIPYGVAVPAKTPLDCVARLVTPAVAAAAQAFFACPSLAGAELENQDPAVCFAQGSHLEQRVHAGDLMAPYATQAALISPVMLAVFQDSGWYNANFAGASPWREGLDYGFHAGCAFAQSQCNASNVGAYTPSNAPWHFDVSDFGVVSCSSILGCATHSPILGSAVCTTDRRAWGSVSLGDLSPPPPPTFRYFPADASEGSPAPATDWCPTVEYDVALSSSTCTDASVAPEYPYESTGPRSMCLQSSLPIAAGSSALGVGTKARGVACFQVVCSPAGGGAGAAVSLLIPGGIGAVPCSPNNLSASVPGYPGFVTCPSPAVACTPGAVWAPAAPFPAPVSAPPSSSGAAPSIVPVAVGCSLGGLALLGLGGGAYIWMTRKAAPADGGMAVLSRQSSANSGFGDTRTPRQSSSAPGSPSSFLATPRPGGDGEGGDGGATAAGATASAAGVGALLAAKPAAAAAAAPAAAAKPAANASVPSGRARGGGGGGRPADAISAPGASSGAPPVLPLIAAAQASAQAQRGLPGKKLLTSPFGGASSATASGLRLPPLASPFSPVYIPVASSDTSRAEGDEAIASPLPSARAEASPRGEGDGAPTFAAARAQGSGQGSPLSPSGLPGASDAVTSPGPLNATSPKPRPSAGATPGGKRK